MAHTFMVVGVVAALGGSGVLHHLVGGGEGIHWGLGGWGEGRAKIGGRDEPPCCANGERKAKI